MVILALLSGFAGLVLGVSSNIKMFILIAFLMTLGAFVAGAAQEGIGLTAVLFATTVLVSSQIGYAAMIVARAAWRDAPEWLRQPASY